MELIAEENMCKTDDVWWTKKKKNFQGRSWKKSWVCIYSPNAFSAIHFYLYDSCRSSGSALRMAAWNPLTVSKLFVKCNINNVVFPNVTLSLWAYLYLQRDYSCHEIKCKKLKSATTNKVSTFLKRGWSSYSNNVWSQIS